MPISKNALNLPIPIPASSLIESDITLAESQVTNLTTDLASKLNLSGGTMSGNLILNGDPTSNLQAATKQYVDNFPFDSASNYAYGTMAFSTTTPMSFTDYNVYHPVAGTLLYPNFTVAAATTGPLSGTYNNGASGIGSSFTLSTNGLFSMDGVTAASNQRWLLKDQAAARVNGIYLIGVTGNPSTPAMFLRTNDYTSAGQMNIGNIIFVTNGTTNANANYIQTSAVNTVGTDNVNFTFFNKNFIAGNDISTGASYLQYIGTDACNFQLSVMASLIKASSGVVNLYGIRLGIDSGSGIVLTDTAYSYEGFGQATGGTYVPRAISLNLIWFMNPMDKFYLMVANLSSGSLAIDNAFLISSAQFNVVSLN